MSLEPQRGVALITALLVIALVTVAAVAMASRQQIDIRRRANITDADQAHWLSLGLVWLEGLGPVFVQGMGLIAGTIGGGRVLCPRLHAERKLIGLVGVDDVGAAADVDLLS